MDISELEELQEEIEERKTKKAQLEGEKNAILKQLKTEFGCSSIKQAEALVDQKTKEVEKLDKEIREGLEELENELNG